MVSPIAGPAARARGFTLPELMAVVAIAAILAGIGVPSFVSLTANIRARGAESDLYAALSLARSEAIKRNAQVTLQPASGGWQAGWDTFDSSGTKLYTHAAIPNATISGPTSVVYQPTGRVKDNAQPSFDISVTGLSQHRCVSVDLSGHTTQSSSACTP
jgi:type IV fimbrial biogenesis protein FimT